MSRRVNTVLLNAMLASFASMPLLAEGIKGDNTRLNRADLPTAEDQGLGERDTDLTARIRSSIVKDASLSTYGQNVKIIVNDGKVTLRGPVRSEQEKQNIVKKAQAIAGAQNVKQEMNVVKQ